MKDEWIQKVSRAAGGATQHARHPSTSGTFYLSKGRNFSGVNYEAEIPAGLHISCGFAPSMASQTSFGELSLARSGLSVLSSREPIRLRTAVSSGEFRSAGLSIDWQTLADHDLPACLAAIPDNVCMGVERIPPRIVAALVAPIDEWFQGTARPRYRRSLACTIRGAGTVPRNEFRDTGIVTESKLGKCRAGDRRCRVCRDSHHPQSRRSTEMQSEDPDLGFPSKFRNNDWRLSH